VRLTNTVYRVMRRWFGTSEIVGGGVTRQPARRRRTLALEPLDNRELLAAVADLVAYRPQTTHFNFAAYPVAEAVETDPAQGPGIRINGDDDNGNRRADYLDTTTSTAGDNDLVRVDTRGTGTQMTLAWTGPLAVWTTRTKSAPVANGAKVTTGQTLWVEYTSQTHSSANSAAMTLSVADAASSTTATDQVVFHSFRSEVIIIGGNTQEPKNVGTAGLGIFNLGASLYARGYDVQLFAHGQVQSTGRGAAYDEVASAVLNRNVDNIAIMGYSWGGGATYELAAGLKANSALAAAGYQLQFTAYIDAIRHYSLTAETRLPPGAKYLQNYYQRRDFLLKGNAASGANNVNVTSTAWGASLSHTTIDDSPTLHADLINALTTRVVV
jgi:hypothetical protein